MVSSSNWFICCIVAISVMVTRAAMPEAGKIIEDRKGIEKQLRQRRISVERRDTDAKLANEVVSKRKTRNRRRSNQSRGLKASKKSADDCCGNKYYNAKSTRVDIAPTSSPTQMPTFCTCLRMEGGCGKKGDTAEVAVETCTPGEDTRFADDDPLPPLPEIQLPAPTVAPSPSPTTVAPSPRPTKLITNESMDFHVFFDEQAKESLPGELFYHGS
uniref:Uncharacterized protein n=1 Tax=Ditylum brightwellii TaxID=49249 RepID=A0A6V2CN42_9STRA